MQDGAAGVKRECGTSDDLQPQAKMTKFSSPSKGLERPPWFQDTENTIEVLMPEGLRLFTARKLNGVPLTTLTTKEELKAASCHYKPDFNGKPFPHWVTTAYTNVANKYVLQHLSQQDFALATAAIKKNGHPDNLKILEEFDLWAVNTTFAHK